jgi:multiple sugar transport system substrate-binding protein
LFAAIALLPLIALLAHRQRSLPAPAGRQEVVFWHFWGGKDRQVVDDIVARFNGSQSTHFVRAVAMPGQNVDLKFFLGVAGGAPPDVVNQDDPIVADWASRGALTPLEELCGAAEAARLEQWLFPAARAIGLYNHKLYALCNGLDIRALYYDQAALEEIGLAPPQTLAELDAIAERIASAGSSQPIERYGFLPDPRRIWAWGVVFGGRFYNPTTDQITADSDPILAAADWMADYGRRYGYAEVTRFRKGDQALPGAAFPLLQKRYAVVMDGQWRVAEIAAAVAAANARGEPAPRIGVVPLPPPPGGLKNAGWVNGNFFVVPRGARNSAGTWEFMKFWSGFDGHADDAAAACAAGGWVPAAQEVVERPAFQSYLERNPMFRLFVELSASPNELPTPAIPGAQFFQDEISRAAEDALAGRLPARAAIQNATQRVRARLTEVAE